MRSFRYALVLGMAAGLLVMGQACANRADDCDANSTCPGADGGSSTSGGSAGKGGTTRGGSSGLAGEGGTTSDGGTSGSGGTGNSGTAGSGGAGGAQPCDGTCTGSTPVCDESSNTCVGCLGNSDCDGATPLCDTNTNTCVECLGNADCTDATASKCDAGTCTGCGANADCSHINGMTVCDAEASECVECTGTDYSACGDDMGTPLVCDSLLRTCTSNKEHDVSACKPCVSDAHCKLGQMCVLETFQSQDVGYFCFWKQSGGNGAPTDCAATGRPYVDLLQNSVSVDGTTADICALQVSTCPARNEFGTKDCATSAAADDSKCSFDAPNDSKCFQVSASVFHCTMVCSNDNDCPTGISCDTGATPSVCQL